MTREGYVYAIRAGQRNLFKIGYESSKGLRLPGLQVGSHDQLRYFFWLESADARTAERWLHEHLAEYRVSGEWFKITAAQVREAFATVPNAEEVVAAPATETNSCGGSWSLRTDVRAKWIAKGCAARQDVPVAIWVADAIFEKAERYAKQSKDALLVEQLENVKQGRLQI